MASSSEVQLEADWLQVQPAGRMRELPWVGVVGGAGGELVVGVIVLVVGAEEAYCTARSRMAKPQ